tara:strand:+ start:67 stop:579 length:513 start_codon:yes stop_codon:yes gene_type:complete
MNGFSGFGNSPAKQKIGAGRKLGKVVGKIAKKISKSTTQDEKDAPKKKSRTLTNKMKPKGGQRLMSIRTDAKTGKKDGGTTYIKSKTITKEQFGMSDKRYIKLQKNREYDEHARKTGALPDFKAIKNDSTRSAQMVKFYSNKSNVNKLNKGQTEYFKKTGGWDKKERLIK